MKIISDNRKARFDYFIDDKIEAGIELVGWEVKSARAGTVNLQDSYVSFKDGEAWLKNAHFSEYSFGDVATQVTRRDRKLLLNKTQINKLSIAVKTKGYTCIATKIYLSPKGLVKVEIALAKGKHSYDKKQSIKEKDLQREAEKSTIMY